MKNLVLIIIIVILPYIGSNWVHPDTDKDRQNFLEISKVNLIKFEVGFKDVTTKTHDWVETNFWEKFNEDDYSLLFITSAGHPEYPFHKIKNNNRKYSHCKWWS